MKTTVFQKTTLAIGGVTALAIGTFLLCAPQAFYASYGVTLDQDPSLLSDLRAPGTGLAAFGGVILAGAFREALTSIAVIAALTIYIAFPFGRVVSLLVDGTPSSGILGAFAIELVIACLLILAFGPLRIRRSVHAQARLAE